MEEKKLTDEVVAKNAITDEEYVKILEHCTGLQACHNCEYNDGCPIDNETTVAVIHRLQADNKRLKGLVSGLEDEKKVESIIFGLKETIAEQKAEIERMTEERDVYLDDCSAVRHKLRQEIEEKFELQKQVELLKDRLAKTTDAIDTALYVTDACQKKLEQAVKDTAKEIFTELLKGENVCEEVVKDYYGEDYIMSAVTVDKIRELAKEQYGIEVE